MNRMTMKTEMIAVAIIASMLAFADSDSVTLDGYTWQYDIGKGDPKTAYITGVSPKKGDIVIPSIFIYETLNVKIIMTWWSAQ